MQRSVRIALVAALLVAFASVGVLSYAQRDSQQQPATNDAQPDQPATQQQPQQPSDEGEPRALDTEAVSYALGYRIGSDMHQHGVDFDAERFAAGFADGLNDGAPELTEEQMMEALISFQMRMQQRQQQQADRRRQEAQQFLEQNAQRQAVQVTDSGLQYEVLEQGDGDTPAAGDVVSVHYEGRMIDGQVFDSSYERGEPSQFPTDRVIAGWTEALTMMQVGDHWRVYIPGALGYGEGGNPAAGIPPDAVLIFEIELLDIVENNNQP